VANARFPISLRFISIYQFWFRIQFTLSSLTFSLIPPAFFSVIA
jgi:hypothetical protein